MQHLPQVEKGRSKSADNVLFESEKSSSNVKDVLQLMQERIHPTTKENTAVLPVPSVRKVKSQPVKDSSLRAYFDYYRRKREAQKQPKNAEWNYLPSVAGMKPASNAQNSLVTPKKEVDEIMRLMKKEAEGEWSHNVLNHGERALLLIKKSEEFFPDMSQYLAQIYSLMARAYEIQEDYDSMRMYCTKLANLATESGSLGIHAKLRISVGRWHACQEDYQKAIDIWLSILPYVKDQEEKTWLLLGIAQIYFRTGELTKANDYAYRSLKEAKHQNSLLCCVKVCMLIAQTETRLDEWPKAKSMLEAAEKYAGKLGHVATSNSVRKLKAQLEKVWIDD